LISCASCSRSLIGETHKGFTYYRCQTRSCPPTCIREEAVEEAALRQLCPLQFNPEEKAYFQAKLQDLRRDWKSEREEQTKIIKLRISHIQDRLNRLTDAYIDQVIERDIFEGRKATLLLEQKDAEERLTLLEANTQSSTDRLAEFLELAGSAYFLYKLGLPEEKRDLLKIATSNRQVEGKRVDFTLSFPFLEVANRFKNTNGAPDRDIPRTWDSLLSQLAKHFTQNPAPQIASADYSALKHNKE
jgi:hypothetical protein